MKTYLNLLGILLIICTTVQCSSDDSTNENLPPVSNPIADFASNTTTIRVGTSTEVEPFIAYNTAGTYSVSLTAINADGTNTLNKENFINVVE